MLGDKKGAKIQSCLLIQVAALAPLALLLVLEARCGSIILCCGVVHHCSYTAHVQIKL